MKKSKGMLFKYMPEADLSGNITRTLVSAGDVKGYFLPYNSEIASNKDGYSENNSWNFYYRGANPDLIAGNIIRYGDEDFHIVSVSNMGRIKIVKLNRLVGTRIVRNTVQVLKY